MAQHVPNAPLGTLSILTDANSSIKTILASAETLILLELTTILLLLLHLNVPVVTTSITATPQRVAAAGGAAALQLALSRGK